LEVFSANTSAPVSMVATINPPDSKLINELIPTQTGIRNRERLKRMLTYAKEGGIFDYSNIKKLDPNFKHPLINILACEDGKNYVWDGHHRVTAILLSGRKILFPSEYTIMEKQYSQLLCPNLQTCFFTPFDPRSELRLPEFGSFKSKVNQMIDQNKSPHEIQDFIFHSREKYCTKRNFSSFDDLIERSGLKSLLS